VNLSYAHGPGTTPLLADTIGGALNTAAARWADRDALFRATNSSATHTQLRLRLIAFARALMAIGVQRGDRVGIWSANRAEWMITQYAAAKAGAVLVNINPAYRLRELEYVLAQSGVSVLIAARRFRTTDYVEMLLRLIPKLGTTPQGRPLTAERTPALREVVYLGAAAQPGGLAWPDFVARGDAMT
jgi:fatty-acyl-CoA synthase